MRKFFKSLMIVLHRSRRDSVSDESEREALIEIRRKLAHHANVKRVMPRVRNISKCRFVVLDTETTGLNPYSGDEIISIGAIAVKEGKVCEEEAFEAVVDPGRSIPPLVSELTGITNQQVAGKPRLVQVMPGFLDFVGDSVIAGHSVEFDMAFLNLKLKRWIGHPLRNCVLDTLSLSWKLHPQWQSYTLESLLAHYGLPVIGRHTALGDALMTARILSILLEELLHRRIEDITDVLDYLKTDYYLWGRRTIPHSY